jgi:hypothetical protein
MDCVCCEIALSKVKGSNTAGLSDGELAANSAGLSICRTALPSARNSKSNLPASAVLAISMA